MGEQSPAIPQPHLDLQIEKDGMSATLELKGRYDARFQYEDIIDLLNDYHIVFGTDITFLKKIIRDFEKDQSPEKVVRGVVAEGVPAVPAVDGKIIFHLKESPKVSIDEHGKADFRNIKKYLTVEPGQPLARKIDPVEGKPGMNIYGKVIEPKKPNVPRLKVGENVNFDKDSNEYVSKIHGIFVKSDDGIDVSPVLEIAKNVGLESGNVNYEGNVKIGGNIERGTIVVALGDVTVGGVIESGNIRIGGTLKAEKGIITRKEGHIHVDGNLSAVFIENSDVFAEGTVIASRSIITSNIVSHHDVYLSAPGSKLAGGDVTAFGSVGAAIIGSKTETHTIIRLGEHFNNMQYYKMHLEELKKADHDLEELTHAVEQIKAFLQRKPKGGVPLEKQAEMRLKYKEYKDAVALKKRIQTQVKELQKTRYNQQEVRIIAREMLYPGVEIHYQGHTQKIERAMAKTILVFNPESIKPTVKPFLGDGKKKGPGEAKGEPAAEP